MYFDENYSMREKVDWDKEIQFLREKLLKTTIEKTPTIIKNIYDEHPAVTLMKEQQVRNFRKTYNLHVTLSKGIYDVKNGNVF
jgi:hypothetical protein